MMCICLFDFCVPYQLSGEEMAAEYSQVLDWYVVFV